MSEWFGNEPYVVKKNDSTANIEEVTMVSDDCGYPIEVSVFDENNADVITTTNQLESRISNLEDTIARVCSLNRHLEEKVILYKCTTILMVATIAISVIGYFLWVRI